MCTKYNAYTVSDENTNELPGGDICFLAPNDCHYLEIGANVNCYNISSKKTENVDFYMNFKFCDIW